MSLFSVKGYVRDKSTAGVVRRVMWELDGGGLIEAMSHREALDQAIRSYDENAPDGAPPSGSLEWRCYPIGKPAGRPIVKFREIDREAMKAAQTRAYLAAKPPKDQP